MAKKNNDFINGFMTAVKVLNRKSKSKIYIDRSELEAEAPEKSITESNISELGRNLNDYLDIPTFIRRGLPLSNV